MPRPVRRAYIDNSYGQLHYRIARPAAEPRFPPLVCLHMSPMSGRIYQRFMAEMAEDRVVVAPDTPGFGASDVGDTPPELEDYAREMVAMVHALELPGPIDLMGYHTGSMTSAEIAHQHPELVRRIVMVSAPVMTPEERAHFKQLYGPKPLSEDGSHLAQSWQTFIQYWRGPGQRLEDVADMFPEKLVGRTKSTWGHRAAFNHEYAKRVASLDQAVLVLNPQDDVWEVTPRVVPLLRNGRVLDLPAFGHGFLDAHTADAAAIVRSFLDAGSGALEAARATPGALGKAA